MAPKCPLCEADVRARAENGAFPFCSRRCRLIDLGNWLGERYAIAAEPVAPSAEDHETHAFA